MDIFEEHSHRVQDLLKPINLSKTGSHNFSRTQDRRTEKSTNFTYFSYLDDKYIKKVKNENASVNLGWK